MSVNDPAADSSCAHNHLDGNAVQRNEISAIRVATWNVAAVNNNPFEFWVSTEDEEYNNLMQAVDVFFRSPNDDVPVHKIFTHKMYLDLVNEMERTGMINLDRLSSFWTIDYSQRMAVAEFLRDPELGSKRLLSMPDRITNTINLVNGGTIHRPSVVNAYCGGQLSSISEWWPQWLSFIFHTEVH